MDESMKQARSYDDAVETLLTSDYAVIDLLPRQVPEDSGGQLFAVEAFYLQPEQLRQLYRRFAHILLKLNCYYDFALGGEEAGWIENPPPQTLVDRVLCCAEGGYLLILLPRERALLTLSGGDLCMTVYHPSPALADTAAQLAGAAGLFLWRPPQEKE